MAINVCVVMMLQIYYQPIRLNAILGVLEIKISFVAAHGE